ncbi:MAG: DegV family protein [Candidatus Coproplasma sp.]
MGFDIFVDSSANLTEEMIEENNIGVVSYVCTIDGKDMQCYEKDRPYKQTAKDFYDAMRAGSDTRTSLINADKFIAAVTPSMEAGKDVLFVTISSGVSGTYNQAKLAAEELKERFPERKMLVCDGWNASLGEGMLAVYAAKMRDKGESIETCAKWIEEHKHNMNSVFTVNDLKYLKRGGRISATVAIAGTLLNIKPILIADPNGKISQYGTERGRKKALTRLANHFAERVIDPENQTVCISHADCEEDALYLAELIKERGAKDVVVQWYDICTGSHVGPGTVALFFMGKDRRDKGETAEHRILISKAKDLLTKKNDD